MLFFKKKNETKQNKQTNKQKKKKKEKHLNSVNSESLKVGLQIHKGKTKYTTIRADSEGILIDQEKLKK